MKKTKKDVELLVKGLKEVHQIRSGLLGLILIQSIFTALSPFINIYMSGTIIDGIANRLTFQELLFLVFVTVGLNLFVAVMSSALRHLTNRFSTEFGIRYRMRQNEKISRMEYARVESPETHRMRQRINDFADLNNGGVTGLPAFVQTLVTHIFTIVFSVSLTVSLFIAPPVQGDTWVRIITSPVTSLVILGLVLLNVLIGMHSASAQTKKMYELMGGATQFNRTYDYYLENYLLNYKQGKDIRIYKQQEVIQSEYLGIIGSVQNMIRKLSRNQTKYLTLTTGASVVLSCIVYLYIGTKALLGLIGVGSIVRYVESITQFASGFTGLMKQFAVMKTNREAMEAYFAFMEIPEADVQGDRPLAWQKTGDWEIEFENVSFRYPGTETYALKNLNLKLRSGRKFAVVGMNGSGKTTMVKLLCGLYQPTEGVIKWNGTDIRELRAAEYAKLFGVVFQDFKLFSFELGQNVAAKAQFDEKTVRECLNKVGFSERMLQMPKGVYTPLYKDFEADGVEISGGEAQKIAIARALYKDAPFVVLDEPTAALDPVAEYEIYSKFNEMVKNKTALYISHRLSSCRFCDDIIVLHEGGLVQYGSHEDLLKEYDGKYYELWNAQAQYYV